MYYKKINDLTPLCCEQYFHFYSPPASSGTASSILLLKPVRGSAKYFSSFFNRSIDCWNSLNPSIRSADSLFMFKTLLSSVDLTKFLIGDVFLVAEYESRLYGLWILSYKLYGFNCVILVIQSPRACPPCLLLISGCRRRGKICLVLNFNHHI
jgi:hypothetical protein